MSDGDFIAMSHKVKVNGGGGGKGGREGGREGGNRGGSATIGGGSCTPIFFKF